MIESRSWFVPPNAGTMPLMTGRVTQRATVIAALRAVGCVFAEDEARLLLEAARQRCR